MSEGNVAMLGHIHSQLFSFNPDASRPNERLDFYDRLFYNVALSVYLLCGPACLSTLGQHVKQRS